MIEVGDLVKDKWTTNAARRRQTLLVIRISDDMKAALCMQGSKKIWFSLNTLEKL